MAGCFEPEARAARDGGSYSRSPGAPPARGPRRARLDPGQVGQQQEGAAGRRPDFPPLQFIDPKTKKPSGYMVELTELMMSDLGVTPEWVQTPFAQLFAGLAAGKFDMVGIAATILPSRALQGYFAGVPVFYESNVVLVKKKLERAQTAALEKAKFAVLQGSSQQASGQVIFPNASFKAFASESDAATEVSVGRADAAIFSEFSTGSILGNNSNLRPLGGPPLFVDANTYLHAARRREALALGDELAALPERAPDDGERLEEVGRAAARKYHLATSLVGTDGVQVPYTT